MLNRRNMLDKNCRETSKLHKNGILKGQSSGKKLVTLTSMLLLPLPSKSFLPSLLMPI